MIDLNNSIDPEIISLCPLCDGPMFDWDECVVISAGGAKCLAHSSCTLDNLPPEDGEEK